ncbi:MAG TPA: pyrimidine-nucleoside phosphorylase [Clostridia bacterium]|nr:pyrimidine-nucleoside phosphorylase [Clostridia bacterium]
MRMYEIIEKKRDGQVLSREEIQFFVNGYCEGSIPDYQASALLMAIFLKGMDEYETAELTMAMADSGERIDLSDIPGVKVDKHSTGGVGDKTTLIVAPIVAACGIPVAKMSGRGLGHTGGTIDKLESIPGFKTGLTREEFIKNVKTSSISIAGQTGNLAPADKKLYSLRDVTATVNNISLIASSIMSKKIASGADRIVLDVKTGSGAFMKTVEDSKKLAQAMVNIGSSVGRKTCAVITDMDIPLGNAIGNSLEVIEAIETLKGKGPDDLTAVCIVLAAKMLELTGVGNNKFCTGKAEEAVANGSAIKELSLLIENQGGNPEVINNYDLFGKAESSFDFICDRDGYIGHIKTDKLGIASMVLGAGRETKEAAIDYSAGIILNKKTGMKVKNGEVIAKLFTNRPDKVSGAIAILKDVFEIQDNKPEERPLVLGIVE